MRNLYVVLSLALFASCSKNSGTPDPIVAFGYTRSIYEVGEKIQVVNKCQNVERYEWTIDYKKDSVKTDENPVFNGRSTAGTHAITLEGYNAAGVKNGAVNPFSVGRRYLKSVTISSLSFTRPNGQPWHTDGTGPDVAYSLVNPAGVVVYGGSAFANTKSLAGSSGLYWSVATKKAELNNGSWSVQIYDTKNAGNPELMFALPLTMSGPPANRDVKGNGSYEIKSGSWAATVEVETLE
jgi:hypothetical protein